MHDLGASGSVSTGVFTTVCIEVDTDSGHWQAEVTHRVAVVSSSHSVQFCLCLVANVKDNKRRFKKKKHPR